MHCVFIYVTFSNLDFNNQNMTMNNSGYSNQMKNIPYMDTNKQYNNFQQQQQQQQQDQVPDSMPNQMSMFAQPVVQDMALQYGAQVYYISIHHQ